MSHLDKMKHQDAITLAFQVWKRGLSEFTGLYVGYGSFKPKTNNLVAYFEV